MSLEPFSAVLFASYGGPNRPDEVLPFMRNATRGRGIPDERLMEVSQHYMLFGGKSPINELNAKLMADVRAEFLRRGLDVPVVIGNRNWEPYFDQTITELVDQGHERVVALATSAYQSYSSCRQYCEDLDRASRDQPIAIEKIDPFWDDPAFALANARSVVAAVRQLRTRIGDGALKLLFVTHSIPLAMNELSATGGPGERYEQQHLKVAESVARLAADELGEELDWELTFCSRSGAAHIPWLEPDVNDRIAQLSDVGVVVAPIGFISDHMEVAYDLDTEASATAKEYGLEYVRAATVGTDSGFVKLIVDRLLDRAAMARGEIQPRGNCRFSSGECCKPRNTPNNHRGA